MMFFSFLDWNLSIWFIFSSLLELDGTMFVALKVQKKQKKKQTDKLDMMMSLSKYHVLVSQANP